MAWRVLIFSTALVSPLLYSSLLSSQSVNMWHKEPASIHGHGEVLLYMVCM